MHNSRVQISRFPLHCYMYNQDRMLVWGITGCVPGCASTNMLVSIYTPEWRQDSGRLESYAIEHNAVSVTSTSTWTGWSNIQYSNHADHWGRNIYLCSTRLENWEWLLICIWILTLCNLLFSAKSQDVSHLWLTCNDGYRKCTCPRYLQ